jgi:ABC-2 type transport system ATP-binding protein
MVQSAPPVAEPARPATADHEPPVTQDTIIEIAGLHQRFGRRARTVTALAGVDLTVRRGEIFGLLGRNGAGKTTLVKALLGLLRPTSGTVRVFGCEPGDAGARARIGYSPEEPGFPRYLYPRQVLELCGALSGMTGTALAAAVERQLVSSELQSVAGRQARQLSKGMAQRLSLAQAFLHEPELLVLDEPTADLDPIGRRQVRDLIVAVRARGGTVLLNSHLLSEAERMCDRVAIIHGGRVMREGAVDELLAGDRELEDVFIEVVEGAGGGTGYGPAAGWASPFPPPPASAGQPGTPAPPPASAGQPGTPAPPPQPGPPPTEHPPWLAP